MPLIDPPLTPEEREGMFSHARALKGTPWRHQGHTERGVDCLGFVWLVLYRTVLASRGVKLPMPRTDYGRTPHNNKLHDGLVEWLGDPVTDAPRPGDVAVLRWTGDAHHVAIVVPHPFHGLGLIHADNSAAGGPRVVEHGWDYVWDRRFVEAFRP